jgi:prephenate dehydrogenase
MMTTSAAAPIRRVAVIGVGLMGGSLALAAQRHPDVEEVRGHDSDRGALADALERGVVSEAYGSVRDAVAGADVAVICTPVKDIPGLVEECLAADPPPSLVTDMGSTKSGVIDSLSAEARHRFIGGHPMCGGETTGVRYARGNLYEGATYFLCAPPEAPPEVYGLAHSFVAQVLGARPVGIEPEVHDRIVALVSHVPHVLANVIMTEVGSFDSGGRRALYSVGPSFKDLTRVAGANPRMWLDIFLENRGAVVRSLRNIAEEVGRFCDSLEAADEERVIASIGAAASYRQELLAYEDISPETLHQLTVRIPDEPGVLSRVMTALGNASINVEDLALHHHSRSEGGELVVFVAGEEAANTAGGLLNGLGFPTIVAFAGGYVG